jgi:membrane dipeptidase
VFSHSNPKELWDHDRTIRDDQVRACAARGGWIGVAGVGIFMGDDGASTATRFRQIDHWVQRVVPRHVGLGTDFVHYPHDMQRYMRSVKSLPGGRYGRMLSFFQPEQLPELGDLMLVAGYDEQAVAGILGYNYLRVLEACSVE